MFNYLQTSFNNSHVCKFFIMLQMEVEENLMLNGYPYIENANDGHVQDNITYFSLENNLEQIPFNHDL